MTAGYAVELAESPKRAREAAETTSIALAIVALDRLGAAGTDLARELGGRAAHVLVIEEEAAGTAAGPTIAANGIICRPLSEPAVLAQVKSALGVAASGERRRVAPQVLRFEGYTLDADGRTCVDASGQEVVLTRAEFSLLLALARQPGRVLSRDELSQAVTGRGAEPDDRSVDVLMSRLRRKIEPDPKTPRIIVTMPGEGYKFTAKPQAVVAPDPMSASPTSTIAASPGAKDALVQDAAAPDAETQGKEARATQARSTWAMRPRQAVLAVMLVVAALGWVAWSNRAALRQAEVTPPTTAPEPRPPSKIGRASCRERV